jgi:phosphatidylinositol alpha-1,6-mannosyltransferase
MKLSPLMKSTSLQNSFAPPAVSPMNVLFMADSFLPHAGGSRVYYYNLYSRWAAAYPDRLTLLTKKVPGWETFDRAIPQHGLQIVRRFKPLPDLSLRHLPKILLPLWETIIRMVFEKIDIMHSGDLYPQGVISLWLKEMFGLPYLAYCHGEDITLTEKSSYQRSVRNAIYRRADAVIAACEFARQNLLDIGIPDERITKITPGVDSERFSPRPRSGDVVRGLGLQDRQVLVTVARLMPRKGHAIVLRALARMIYTMPNICYVIVGTGPERKRLEQLAAELGISEAVRFAGYVPEESLSEFYNIADIFVMMNREEENGDIEGFGMVFLEASAAGKPVLGGRSGGTADSIRHGETGYLVDPEDVEELVARLRTLLVNKDLCAQMGRTGMQWARAEFSWSARAQRLRQVSQEAITRSRIGARRAKRMMTLPTSDRFTQRPSQSE